jgi:hypothetical protein
MSVAIRMISSLALLLALTGGMWAQETTATTETTTTTDTTATAATGTAVEGAKPVTSDPDLEAQAKYETRNQFTRVVQRHPDQVATVLVLEPGLLSNEQFLKGYPEIADFIAKHPEVARTPTFYLADFGERRSHRGPFEDVLEGIYMLVIFCLLAFAISWFVRTILEQKRWSRQAKTQTEVHNKILDRFGSTEELMAYIKTPAGARFLESAPIPLQVEHAPRQNPPHTRLLWSIQIGVVIAAGALGMLVVSGRFDRETAQDMFAMGTIGFCIGAGFVASALVSLFLSRRLALWQQPPNDDTVQ